MADRVTLFVITDGNGNCRVGCTPGSVESRVEALQAGNALRLRRVHSEAVPAEMARSVLAAVRRALGGRHIRGDWYRADAITTLGAVSAALAHAASLTAPLPPLPPEPPPQAPTGPDADPPRTAFDEELDDARGRVNLVGRSSRKLLDPWE